MLRSLASCIAVVSSVAVASSVALATQTARTQIASPSPQNQLSSASAPSFGVLPKFPWGVFVGNDAYLNGAVTGGIAVGGRLESTKRGAFHAAHICTAGHCGANPMAFGLVQQVLKFDSSRWATLGSNMGVQIDSNTITFRGVNRSLDVVDLRGLPAGQVKVDIVAPSTATVFIDVSKSALVSLDRLSSINLLGVSTSRLLWNFAAVASLRLPSIPFNGSILAPDASVIASAAINGDVITENLSVDSVHPIKVHDNADGFSGVLPQYPVTQVSAPAIITKAPARVLAILN